MKKEYIERARGFAGLIGVAREDISPPAGIYSRCWGAATEFTATGLDMPLSLTALAFSNPEIDDERYVLLAIDGTWWQSQQESFLRRSVCEANGLNLHQVIGNLSHTHSGVPLTGDHEGLPGGELLQPYITEIIEAAVRASRAAFADSRPACLEWRYGHCGLASDRDFQPDPHGEFSIGYNPSGEADGTTAVGRVTDLKGELIATVVNYACHPTTLAWDNRLISPDYIGGMREVVERETGGKPCLFLQGASGNLAPRLQYVGDPAIARRHGRQLGYAAMSTLAGMADTPSKLVFREVRKSGANLAVWTEETDSLPSELSGKCHYLELAIKGDFPTLAILESDIAATDDPVMRERLRRKIRIRKIVGEDASFRFPVWIWRLGDSAVIGHPGEAYSEMQTTVRAAFPGLPVIVMNVANGSIGYLPPAKDYSKPGFYTVWQTPFAPGCLEKLTDHCIETISAIFPEFE